MKVIGGLALPFLFRDLYLENHLLEMKLCYNFWGI